MMIDETKARYYGWSAVFCLFGYRATFAILEGPMAITLGWTAEQVTLGYSLMMVFYAVVDMNQLCKVREVTGSKAVRNPK